MIFVKNARWRENEPKVYFSFLVDSTTFWIVCVDRALKIVERLFRFFLTSRCPVCVEILGPRSSTSGCKYFSGLYLNFPSRGRF